MFKPSAHEPTSATFEALSFIFVPAPSWSKRGSRRIGNLVQRKWLFSMLYQVDILWTDMNPAVPSWVKQTKSVLLKMCYLCNFGVLFKVNALFHQPKQGPSAAQLAECYSNGFGWQNMKKAIQNPTGRFGGCPPRFIPLTKIIKTFILNAVVFFSSSYKMIS